MNTKEKIKTTYLHFILCIFVILIHAINNETLFESIFSIEKGIGQFATPLFFVISGFLFFKNVYIVNDAYKKIKKRIFTLFIPFVLWNFIYYVFHLIFKPQNGFSLSLFIDAVFKYRYNPPFWFMYQLIILVIISPLICYVLKNKKYFAIFILFASLFVAFNIDIKIVNLDALIYYTCGGFFSKAYNSNKIKYIDKKNVIYFLFISVFFFFFKVVIFAFVNVLFKTLGAYNLATIYYRLSVSFFIFYFIDILFKYDKSYKFMNNSFFLHAIHYVVVRALFIITKFITLKLNNLNLVLGIETIVFILTPIFIIFIGNFLSKFLKSKFSNIYNYLVGNR